MQPEALGDLANDAFVPAWCIPIDPQGTNDTCPLCVKTLCVEFVFKYPKVMHMAEVKANLTLYFLNLREDIKNSEDIIQLTRPPISGAVTKIATSAKAAGKGKGKGKSVRSRAQVAMDTRWKGPKHMFK